MGHKRNSNKLEQLTSFLVVCSIDLNSSCCSTHRQPLLTKHTAHISHAGGLAESVHGHMLWRCAAYLDYPVCGLVLDARAKRNGPRLQQQPQICRQLRTLLEWTALPRPKFVCRAIFSGNLLTRLNTSINSGRCLTKSIQRRLKKSQKMLCEMSRRATLRPTISFNAQISLKT